MSDTNKKFIAALDALDTVKYAYEPLDGPVGLTSDKVNINIDGITNLGVMSCADPSKNLTWGGGCSTVQQPIGPGVGIGANGLVSPYHQSSISIQDAFNNMIKTGLHSPLVNSVDDVVKLLNAKLISKTTAIRLIFPNNSADEHQKFMADIVDDIILGDDKNAT
jgi:hypothetical protein